MHAFYFRNTIFDNRNVFVIQKTKIMFSVPLLNSTRNTRLLFMTSHFAKFNYSLQFKKLVFIYLNNLRSFRLFLCL